MPPPAINAAPAGMLAIRPRDDRGIIGVWGWGMWSPEYADAHFAELARHVADARAAGLPVRVLVNLQKAAAPSAATLDRTRIGANTIYEAGDRIALVVGSSLAKAALGELLDRSKLSFFLSETAAMLWLAPELGWQRDSGSWHA